MDGNALYHPMLVVDVERFGARSYDGQRRLRERLYQVMRSSLNAVGISPEDVRQEDRGDGGFWILPVAVPKAVITGPFVHRLNEELRRHNERPERDVTGLRVMMRLRVALHAGEVGEDTNGWVGPDLNTAFRLVNADAVRRALAEDEEAAFALIMSRHWYEAVRGHRIEELDLAAVRPAHVSSKEVEETAWVYVPGHAVPREPSRRVRERLAELRRFEESVREHRDHIAGRLSRVPDLPDPPVELRHDRRLPSGRWRMRSARELAALGSEDGEKAATRWLERLRSFRAGLDALMTERNDLRKTLEAYRAMQNGSGLAGDTGLSGLYLRARELLWRVPCDLEEAAGAVEDYQRAIRRGRGYGDGERS